jgi:hypothetical protein
MTNETITHEGITYRKVSRKARVGEKVLITESDDFKVGTITECEELCDKYYGKDGSIRVAEYVSDFVKGYIDCSTESYVVLEPVDQPLTQSDDLFVTETDVRNNPRQVIDLIANLAGRLTKLEGEHQALEERHIRLSDNIPGIVLGIDERINRLGDANEQAVNLVARNVETWAQEHEVLKRKVADLNERTQPYQVAHELFVKIAGGMNGRQLTDEERREL